MIANDLSVAPQVFKKAVEQGADDWIEWVSREEFKELDTNAVDGLAKALLELNRLAIAIIAVGVRACIFSRGSLIGIVRLVLMSFWSVIADGFSSWRFEVAGRSSNGVQS